MKVSDFNYNLPKELIAQVPIKNRDQSRLMVLDRKNKTIENKIFRNWLFTIEKHILSIYFNDNEYFLFSILLLLLVSFTNSSLTHPFSILNITSL